MLKIHQWTIGFILESRQVLFQSISWRPASARSKVL